MTSHLDAAVILSAGFSFILFLLIHILGLRSLKKLSAPVIIIASIFFGIIANLLWLFYFSDAWHLKIQFSFWLLLFAAAISILIYLFFVLHYLAFIFGMGEASIRIRLLFEVSKSETSLEEILKNYNADKILTVRLARLVMAGHFMFDGNCYRIKSPVLLIQLWLISFFKRLLGIKEEGN